MAAMEATTKSVGECPDSALEVGLGVTVGVKIGVRARMGDSPLNHELFFFWTFLP